MLRLGSARLGSVHHLRSKQASKQTNEAKTTEYEQRINSSQRAPTSKRATSQQSVSEPSSSPPASQTTTATVCVCVLCLRLRLRLRLRLCLCLRLRRDCVRQKRATVNIEGDGERQPTSTQPTCRGVAMTQRRSVTLPRWLSYPPINAVRPRSAIRAPSSQPTSHWLRLRLRPRPRLRLRLRPRPRPPPPLRLRLRPQLRL